MGSVRIVYDNQAGVFEARAGLPEEAGRRVAAAVHDQGAMVAADAAGDLLVEIGAGTGVIGRWLASLPGRYLGFDNSAAMLDVFRPRLPTGGGALLVHADAGRVWPVRTGAVRVIFGSRVLHLLDPAHALRQAWRVAHPDGAALLCGRVEHDRASPRALARAKLRELLAEHGLCPEPTGGSPTRLLSLARAQGAEAVPTRAVATWPETVAVTQVIDWWRGKTSIGGVNPPAAVAEQILAALIRWAADSFDEPDRGITTHTRYLLEGVRLRVTDTPPDA